MDPLHEQFILEAMKVASQHRVLQRGCDVARVGVMILTTRGNVFTGLAIVQPSGLGNCAEYGAVHSMLMAGNETEICMAVAVSSDGIVLPPCGRCREFFYNINRANLAMRCLWQERPGAPLQVSTLAELLPANWQTALWANRD